MYMALRDAQEAQGGDGVTFRNDDELKAYLDQWLHDAVNFRRLKVASGLSDEAFVTVLMTEGFLSPEAYAKARGWSDEGRAELVEACKKSQYMKGLQERLDDLGASTSEDVRSERKDLLFEKLGLLRESYDHAQETFGPQAAETIWRDDLDEVVFELQTCGAGPFEDPEEYAALMRRIEAHLPDGNSTIVRPR